MMDMKDWPVDAKVHFLNNSNGQFYVAHFAGISNNGCLSLMTFGYAMVLI